MCDTFIFVELLNNIFPLFINNIFQYCEIILEYFLSVNNTHKVTSISKHMERPGDPVRKKIIRWILDG
jgi:hypothetical protein